MSTLAPFPLLLPHAEWHRLARWAEELAMETQAAEATILAQTELLDELGLPRALRSVLRQTAPVTPAAARSMRFDFHPTTDGWRLSEVNSDVPGGFTESSFFTPLIAERFPQYQPAGDPTTAWIDAVNRSAAGAPVALLSAPGYMEDTQIVAFLAARLTERGCAAGIAHPRQLVWRDGLAHLESHWFQGRVGAVVRFFQGEWLARLPERLGWNHLFRGGLTPVANPGVAILAESKRFPLVWDRLGLGMRTWRTLLPETRDPRRAPWKDDRAWLVKSAFSNTGDDVGIHDLLKQEEWRAIRWAVRWQPHRWVAQRRFESVPIETPSGLRHVCLGVYTVDGHAAGAYVRLSERPLIDFAAVDAALLLEKPYDP